MLEWLKRHAWKACIRQKRIRGSNPRLSAWRKRGSKRFRKKRDTSLRKELGRGSADKVNPRLSARNLNKDLVRFS